MEPYHQDEHVTEADMVRRLLSNPRYPITTWTPTTASEVGGRAGYEVKKKRVVSTGAVKVEGDRPGSVESLQFHRLAQNVVRHAKGSEGNLSQQINCYASNAGTERSSLQGRLADSQCRVRGSESVVVGGVTTTRGERERRSQGKGTQTLPVSHTWKRSAIG
jgi:hypothetical protein